MPLTEIAWLLLKLFVLIWFVWYFLFKKPESDEISRHLQCLINIGRLESENKCQDRYLARLMGSDEPTR